MTQSVIAPHHLEELVDAARSAPPGDFVEVGVYRGGSAVLLAEVARATGRRLFLFDTFTGIPFRDAVDRHEVGDFSDTSLEMVREAVPDATFCVGVFPDTMPDDIGPIALAHVDCDQYRSVHDCCAHLGPRMAPGGVMVFDDPNVLDGASQAVRESFSADRIETSAGGKWRVRF
jgi:O-methyltransferase